MWDLKACIVCFSTDVKLFSLNVGRLRNHFNLVSGLKIVEGSGMPDYLCVECTAYVHKFVKFRDKCHRAHYALQRILIKNKEIKTSNLKHFNRRQLEIMPTLSYMSLDRSNYSQYQFQLADKCRDGISQHGCIPVAHCSTLTPEDTFELEMKNVSPTHTKNLIKVESEPVGHNDCNKSNVPLPNKTPDMLNTQITMKDSRKDIVATSKTQAFEMDQNGDDFHDFDETDVDDEKFEPVSCTLNNKVEGVKYSDECGDVLPITVKEARAAVEVHKYTSSGPYQCHCGKSFAIEKNFKTHSRRHDLHISGTYHCEICDYYFKTAFLLQSHMSDQHMYKYLCRMCPEVTFTKPLAKQHYMSHVRPERSFRMGTHQRDTIKKPSYISPAIRGGARVKGSGKVKPKKVIKKLPKDFPVYSPQSPLEQYEMVQRRKESRNYLEAKFKCELCFRGYRLPSTYNKHMAKHDSTISGSFQCDMCKHYYRDTRRLYKHMNMYHLFKYACQFCEFATTHKGQAIYHYKWHKNVTYDCPHCDKKFNKITTQMTHIRFKHPGTDICNICGHSFISSSGLNHHRLIAHTKQEIAMGEAMALAPECASAHYCAECRLQFLTGQAYVVHLGSSKKHVQVNVSSQSVMKNKSKASRSQAGPDAGPDAEPDGGPDAGPVRGRRRRAADSQVLNTGITATTHCNVCGLFLGSDVMARRHYEAEHPGTDYLKRYMCDVCGHTTKQFANLLVHMRTHTREKPYPCPHCDRRFSMPSNRDRHLVVHTGEKRFQCQHCSRRFTQSTAVKLHIQTVHMKIPYKPWDKVNRRRRKEAQQNSAGTELVETGEMAAAAVAPVPQHKLLIEPQGDYITYIYTHTQEQ